MKKQEKIYVIGHKNPDTDSICSAIAYCDIKTEPLRATNIFQREPDRLMRRPSMYWTVLVSCHRDI